MVSTSVLAGLSLVSAVAALDVFRFNLAERNTGFVQLPVIASAPSGNQRRATPGDSLTNDNTRYLIPISLGTPAQETIVLLDTGSAELWVDPDCSTVNPNATHNVELCNSIPRYDASKSSSARDQGQSETINYGDTSNPSSQTSVTIEYYTDTLTIGGSSIRAQIFGVAVASQNIPHGILGVGPDTTDGFSTTQPYSLVIDSLASQGIINSRALSLDLRHENDPSGSIIFGGIDLGKFSGTLQKLPIIPASASPDRAWRYYVTLSSLGSSDATYTLPAGGLTVFLDSGNTYSRLPQSIAQAIYADLGAQLDAGSGLYLVDCSLRSSSGFIAFGFGAKTIKVPYSDFIQQFTGSDGSTACVIGVVATSAAPVLGDSFLRAAYVVFDWDNRNIHLAQADDCGTEVVAIGTGPNAVPSQAGNCGASSTSSSTTTTPPTSTSTPPPSSSSSSATTTSTSNPPPSSSSSSTTLPGKPTSGYNHTTTHGGGHGPTYTSTYYQTTTYTVTSCAPTITDCPVGHKTTETLTSYTTWCPGETETGGGPSTLTPPTTTTTSPPPGYPSKPPSKPSGPTGGGGGGGGPSGPGGSSTYVSKTWSASPTPTATPPPPVVTAAAGSVRAGLGLPGAAVVAGLVLALY